MTSLTVIGFNAVVDHDEAWTHFSFGRILDKLAKNYSTVYWCASVKHSNRDDRYDCPVPANVKIIPVPHYTSTLNAMKKLRGIHKAYEEGIIKGDHVFIRGLIPGTAHIYRRCLIHNKIPLHWLVGNPIKLMRTHKRNNVIYDYMVRYYANKWNRTVKRGLLKTRGAALCNGCEIFEMMKSVRRYETVSSAITSDDFYQREDTCCNEVIRIISLCFIRPEKGIEYLLEAIPLIKTSRNIELYCLGTFEKGSQYREKLNEIVRSHGLTDIVYFMGYKTAAQFQNLSKDCDIFVLPSLSEGTPRCILESRAVGLPTIATNVGGIPSSVTNGTDGILVPPKDPRSIAEGIDRIVEDAVFRRNLIQNGYKTARKYTLDQFTRNVVQILKDINCVKDVF